MLWSLHHQRLEIVTKSEDIMTSVYRKGKKDQINCVYSQDFTRPLPCTIDLSPLQIWEESAIFSAVASGSLESETYENLLNSKIPPKSEIYLFKSLRFIKFVKVNVPGCQAKVETSRLFSKACLARHPSRTSTPSTFPS
jgi:hypothetical protein